jgi:hypothetical protein
VSLGIFLDFLGFSDYFSCFKAFSGLFLELLMHSKIFRKRKKKTQSAPALFLAHPGPSAEEAWRPPPHCRLGVRAQDSGRPRPYKGNRAPLRALGCACTALLRSRRRHPAGARDQTAGATPSILSIPLPSAAGEPSTEFPSSLDSPP